MIDKVPPRPDAGEQGGKTVEVGVDRKVPPRPGQAKPKTHKQLPPRPDDQPDSVTAPALPPRTGRDTVENKPPRPEPADQAAVKDSVLEPSSDSSIPFAEPASAIEAPPKDVAADSAPPREMPPERAGQPAPGKVPETKTPPRPAAADDRSPDEDVEDATFIHWINQSPAWITSMLVHMIVLLVLALWALPQEVKDQFKEIVLIENDTDTEELEELNDESITEEQETDVNIQSDATEAEEAVEQDFDLEAEVPEIDNESDDIELAAAKIEFDPLANLSEASSDLLTGISGGTALKGFGGRSSQGRRAMAQRGGGTPGSENAVEAALRWLAAHQKADGSWSFQHGDAGGCNNRCPGHGSVKSANGATGIALLPFLGAGYTHKEGNYQETVYKGLKYLVGHMETTSKGGKLSDWGHGMYSHGLAAIAICEAYGMTQDPQLREPAQAVLNYIIGVQGPTGGWGYSGPGNDTSVVGWQVMALKSGDMSYLKVPEKTVVNIRRFLDGVQADSGAYYGYTSPSKKASTTSIGLLCRMYTGWPNSHEALTRGVQFLSRTGPIISPDKPSAVNMYYNYYATQVMFQYTSGEGPVWKKWNDVMRNYLVQTQSRRGHEAGSWTLGVYNAHGGRVYSTAMAAMILEIYYRHMPVYRQDVTGDFNKLGQDEDFPLE